MATMDDRSSKADSAGIPAKKSGRFSSKRQRAEELLATQHDRLEQVEAHLGSQLQELSESMIHEVNERFRAEREALDRRTAELAEHARDLDRRWEEQAAGEQRLVARQAELVRREEQIAQSQREWSESHQRTAKQHQHTAEQLRLEHEELSRQRHELESAQTQLHQGRRALKRAEEERDLESEELARRRERVIELEGRLARQSEELELRREQTRNQRRRIAHELQAQRAAQQHEVEALRHKLDLLQSNHQRAFKDELSQVEQQRRELNRELDEQRQECQAVQAALEEKTAALEQAHRDLEVRERRLMQNRSAEAEELAREVERLTAQMDGLTGELQRLTDELAEAQAQAVSAQAQLDDMQAQLVDAQERAVSAQSHLASAATRTDDDEADMVAWNVERESLVQRLAEAEGRLANVDPQKTADLQRRFELAIEDVRSLKRRKSELEEELAAFKAGGSAPAAAFSPDAGDWESQKRKLLASLESDDGAAAVEPEDRLTIESTIQITDEIVAQKDRDITELKRILAQQSDNIGSVSIGAAAVAQTLDQDELIQQEREKLRKLQEEWREKVRQSEIDISIERARMARQRAEIENKVSSYENERAKNPLEGEGAMMADGTKRPARGRWLSRLGLKDNTD